MHSKTIYRIAGAMAIAAALFITSCSKKDNSPAPAPVGGGDSSKPAVAVAPEKYTKKAIVEEFTGTWCGWCPSMPILLDALKEKFPNLIVAAFHGDDVFEIGDALGVIQDNLGITGYPTSMLEKSLKLNSFSDTRQESEDSLTKVLNKTAALGFALNTSISGNTLKVTMQVGVGQTIDTPKVKVLVYVLEDSLVATQNNFFPDYDEFKNHPYLGVLCTLPKKLVGYVHNHVVRKVLTDATGDEIPAASKTKGSIYSKDYTLDISKYKAANLQVVAVAYGEDENNQHLITYNAQVVKAGQSQQFD